jgi:hypothetical protein
MSSSRIISLTLTTERFRRTNALFNAIRKQYGLNTYLLRLRLPAERPAPVAVPAMLPRLPTQFTEDGPVLSRASSSTVLDGIAESAGRPNTLSLHQDDIQETGKFLREFVNQGLVPWMERAVIEWNETVSNSIIKRGLNLISNML